MRVWVDVFSGDEMVSDSYPHQLIYDGAALEVKAKFTTKGNDFIAIAADDEDDGGEGETVINVVDAHKLNELTLSKKDCMGMVKALMKRTVGHLTEKNPDRVDAFKKGATELVKFVMGKFDEMQVFVGENMDTEASIAFAYNADGEADPTFLFFADCMREEKF